MTQMRIRVAVLFALLSLFMVGEAAAAVCTSLSVGPWDQAARWSCGRVPATTDTVVIAHNDVQLRGNYTVAGLTIDAGAVLTDNGNDLTVSGSVLINGSYDGTGNNGNLIMTGNGQTLSGTGTVIDIGRIQIDANITIPVGANLNLTLRSEIRVGDQNPATLTVDGTITGTAQTNGNRIIRADNNNTSNVVINGTINAPNSFVEVQAGGTVTNNGTVSLQYLNGDNSNSSTWVQGGNSNLTLTQPAIQWVGTFDASATGNTVTFNGTATPFDPATYYNLAGTAVTCPLSAGITVLGSSPCATLLAEYRLDETGLGTVADSSANGLNGTISGGVTVGGPGKVCGSYNFNGTDAFVSVPHNALFNQSQITVMAWVRHASATIKSWEAILAKGDTAFRLHLNGGCSINAPNVMDALSFGINSGCATADADSGVIPVAGQWYHVAGTYDGATIRIYVDGVLKASGAYAGAINSNTFPLYIGENSQQTGRHWSGDLDEVKIFDRALSASNIAAGYANENAGKNWNGTGRSCNPIDHVSIAAPATEMALTETSVTITRHTAAHDAVNSTGKINLSTSTGRGDWTIGGGKGVLTPGAANSGSATYSFGVGESVVALGFTYTSAATVTINVADNLGGDLLLYTPASEKANTIVFSMPNFIFTSTACTHNVTFGTPGQCVPVVWSPQIAGQTEPNIYITALNASGVPTRLNRTAIRTRNMQFGLTCHDPVANAGKQAMVSSGSPAIVQTLPLCKANGLPPSAAAEWSTALTASFPAGSPSAGPFAFNYADVGKVELWMRNSAATAEIGSSNEFVVKPGGFVLSEIKPTANAAGRCAVNTTPAPTLACAADAAGNKFVKAGEAFSVTVTATTCVPASATCTVAGAATPNYGQESVSESVKLTPALVAGLGLTNNPAIGGTLGTFASGTATGTAFTWGDVGVITLTPSVGDGDYLGVGDVIGTTTGNVGRFYPDHFDTSIIAASAMPCPDGLTCPCPPTATCPPSLTKFIYSGQPFKIWLTARSATNARTQNYDNASGFSKEVTLSAVDAAGGVASPVGGITPATDTVAAALFSAGQAGVATNIAPVYLFAATPTAPTDIYLRAAEVAGGDGVTSLRAVAASSWEQGIKVMSGRIKLSNGHGSELLALPLAAIVQYYNGSAWVRSDTDTVTTLAASDFALAFPAGTVSRPNNLAACETALAVAGTSPTFALNLSAPGSGNNGWTNLTLNLGAAAAGNRCTAVGAAGAAATTANRPWLQFPSGADPTVRATFGVYKGNNEFIYLRENY